MSEKWEKAWIFETTIAIHEKWESPVEYYEQYLNDRC
jgi:hypothetical protein